MSTVAINKQSTSDHLARLRASREQFVTEEKEHGEKAGERWAIESAEYDQLRRLNAQYGESRVDVTFDAVSVLEVIADDGHPLENELSEFWGPLTHVESLPSDEFCEGFVDGALRIFDQL